MGGQWHGGGGPHPIDLIAPEVLAKLVDRLTGFHVGAGNIEVRVRGLKCLVVKGVQGFRELAVAEVGSAELTGFDQGAEAHVLGIAAVF